MVDFNRYISNTFMMDFAVLCIDRDIIQYDKYGMKINPSSWQQFNWYWEVRYCEFIAINLNNSYFNSANGFLA